MLCIDATPGVVYICLECCLSHFFFGVVAKWRDPYVARYFLACEFGFCVVFYAETKSCRLASGIVYFCLTADIFPKPFFCNRFSNKNFSEILYRFFLSSVDVHESIYFKRAVVAAGDAKQNIFLWICCLCQL